MNDLTKVRCEVLEKEVARLRAEVNAINDAQTPDLVYPGKHAKLVGWDLPGKLQWPGRVVHRFDRGALSLVQFLIWDNHRGQFVLKTWKPEFLVKAIAE